MGRTTRVQVERTLERDGGDVLNGARSCNLGDFGLTSTLR